MIVLPRQSLLAGPRAAFTLVELMVSMVVLVLVMAMLFGIVSQVEGVTQKTTSKTEIFQDSRIALDTITRRLADATLNTYIGYSDGVTGDSFYNTTGFTPKTFVRQSELRFLSGLPATTLNGAPSAVRPTHSIFFVAPLGYTLGNDSGNRALTQMLNVCGYYIEFNSDTNLPAFILSLAGYHIRYRYRLIELLEPSENNSIYTYTTNPATATSNKWITDAYNLSPVPTHILAENVIALIILPQLSTDQKNSAGAPFSPAALAPLYSYDSSSIGQAASDPNDAGALDSLNQLPPIVQVTMVSIDEASAKRLQDQLGSSPPDFGLGSLFQQAQNFDADLDQLRANLDQRNYVDGNTTYSPAVSNLPPGLNYRIFTTMVTIKGAQWSTLQTN